MKEKCAECEALLDKVKEAGSGCYTQAMVRLLSKDPETTKAANALLDHLNKHPDGRRIRRRFPEVT